MINRRELSEYIGQLFVKEASALTGLLDLNPLPLHRAILAIADREGKIVVSGLGKSAIVAQKLVATLNSTGSPSVFLHAADALHGDMGVLMKDDVLILISKSGGTSQMLDLLKYATAQGVVSIGISNVSASRMISEVQYPIVLPTVEEIDDGSIVPTASAVQHLACCDVIAIALQGLHGYTSDDFAKLHPQGTLGRLLSTTAIDLTKENAKPAVPPDADVKSVIYIISSSKMGACCVVEDTRVIGIITDGDIRRMLERHTDLSAITAEQIMSKNPITIDASVSGQSVKEAMSKENINQMVVVNVDHEYLGMIHIHDLITE